MYAFNYIAQTGISPVSVEHGHAHQYRNRQGLLCRHQPRAVPAAAPRPHPPRPAGRRARAARGSRQARARRAQRGLPVASGTASSAAGRHALDRGCGPIEQRRHRTCRRDRVAHFTPWSAACTRARKVDVANEAKAMVAQIAKEHERAKKLLGEAREHADASLADLGRIDPEAPGWQKAIDETQTARTQVEAL